MPASPFPARLARRAAVVIALGVIFALTLVPRPGAVDARFAWCLPCGEFGTLDLLLNTLLFIPLGWALATGLAPRRALMRATLVAGALSLSIELLQLLLPGRDPALADVAGNTLGGTLGAAAAIGLVRLRSSGPATWRVASAAATTGAMALVAFGAWALRWDPPQETYFVQWQPVRPHYDEFRGELRALALNGLTLKPAQTLVPAAIPRAWPGELELAAVVTPGSRPERMALIGRIALASGELLMLGRQGDALVFRYRSNAYRAGLRPPVHALDSSLGGDPGTPTSVAAHLARGMLTLRVDDPAGTHTERRRIGAARVWATVLPLNHAFGGAGTVLDLLFLALLAVPGAFAGTRASVRTGVLATLALAAALGAVALYDPAMRWWPWWAAVTTGALGGIALSRRMRSR